MEIVICPTCDLKHPQGPCPQCDGHPQVDINPEAVWERRLEGLRNRPDTEIRYIYQQVEWEQGNKRLRQACLDEFDRRFGLENWPEGVSKEL